MYALLGIKKPLEKPRNNEFYNHSESTKFSNLPNATLCKLKKNPNKGRNNFGVI